MTKKDYFEAIILAILIFGVLVTSGNVTFNI